MTIKHHLNDALLMAYSAGTLPEAFSLVVATHVSVCDECRARLDSFDAVGGVLLEDCGVVAMNDGALDAAMGRLDAAAQETPEPVEQAIEARDTPNATERVLPAPLRDYVGGDLDAVHWRSVGGGVRQAVLDTWDNQATVRLIHIPAGASVPDHGHRGTELTMVLQGAFRDDTTRFARGDVEIADADMDHTPVADPDQDCICLAAADGRLRFRGLLPRIAQPFVGI